jgi:hypothetical protein
VERDVAAAVGAHNVCAARAERAFAGEHMLALAAHAERIHGRVFKEDEGFAAAVTERIGGAMLHRERTLVRHGAWPDE